MELGKVKCNKGTESGYIVHHLLVEKCTNTKLLVALMHRYNRILKLERFSLFKQVYEFFTDYGSFNCLLWHIAIITSEPSVVKWQFYQVEVPNITCLYCQLHYSSPMKAHFKQ